ncbi:MAG: WYL domain-containing protein [Synechococcaceae bacterium WB8_1B_136]|nr:WYL domain-containing protein [Synechococcaceae bacterium WB8_1B_136]
MFQRVFTLLRHLLQQPFDRASGIPLPEHLIAQIETIPGAYLPGEAATLRKDLEKILTPYGFRQRNDNVRHGYAIGTALLSAHRLREIHGVVSQAAGRLADPTAQDLLAELEQRLHWGGVAIAGTAPVRAFANRSIVSSALVRPDSLAAERQAELLETAIVERRRVELERYASVASFPDSPTGSFRAWPLQLLFHNIGWYLVYETDNVGREEGLIRTERIDRLALRRSERGYRRSDDAHAAALARLDTLLYLSGGIYFGDKPGRCKPCASAARAGALPSSARACSATRLNTPATANRCRATPGGITPRRPTCWSPALQRIPIPIRWNWICPAGPWSATSTCATGCLALAPGAGRDGC